MLVPVLRFSGFGGHQGVGSQMAEDGGQIF